MLALDAHPHVEVLELAGVDIALAASRALGRPKWAVIFGEAGQPRLALECIVSVVGVEVAVLLRADQEDGQAIRQTLSDFVTLIKALARDLLTKKSSLLAGRRARPASA